ncbi:hypothetical protein BLNAU_5655 [Blattamonas nauphoetae]|uniref:Transposase n=1 Tax=Blattamonas nauphoetae TaxID=2049346 RepID=A0ABQ9Y6J6_9EUKA|nr:hypothetical protein BLNAU_5655 [Blattamonas nauphoetae]
MGTRGGLHFINHIADVAHIIDLLTRFVLQQLHQTNLSRRDERVYQTSLNFLRHPKITQKLFKSARLCLIGRFLTSLNVSTHSP